MSRESKVLAVVAGLAVVGLIIAIAVSMTVGLVVVIVALLGAVGALRLLQPDTSDPFAEARSEADESNTGTLTPNDPLTPWSPDGALSAWTPPAEVVPPDPSPTDIMPPAEPVSPPQPAPEPATSYDSSTWDSPTTWDTEPARAAESNPLDDLVGLEALDPIAEVERIEGRAAAAPSLIDFHGGQVNEDVSGADDIMAASQATELNLADGEQTELQKLLAKVQIRLSAYE